MPPRLLLSCLLLIAPASVAGQIVASAQPQDLKKLTIEELTQLDVTTASRRVERLSDTPAAISVVRGEDIRRSGAVILAEALRLADAVDVGRVNGGTWGISTRGFNISTANKLLVLQDGRSTYSSLFGGTFWDVQDTLLADLDRIEVIRGPAGSTWGANAVNGVVNIITKPVAETQGTAISILGGYNERAVVAARHGGTLGRGHYRIYGKYRARGPQATPAGGSAHDELQFGQAGFRFDSDPTAPSHWTLTGAAYVGTNGFSDRPDGDVSGGHVMGRWSRPTRGDGEFRLHAYYDRAYRRVPLQFEGTKHLGEIDAQQRLIRGRHTIVFGGTARAARSDDAGIAGFRFEPQVRDAWTLSGFAQDEFAISPGRAYVIAGAKVGRNNFTGAELLPSLRVRLHPSSRQVVWAAASRAVRLPTRFDEDLRLLLPNGSVFLRGSDDFQPESVVAYEAGYRVRPHVRLSVDAAVFVNQYDQLRSQERRGGVIVLDNLLNATTGGVELSAGLQAAENWRVHGSYAWLRKSLSFDPGSTDSTGGAAEGNDPAHLVSARSYLNLPRGFTFDAILRHVGRRPSPAVEAYAELDLRLGWQVRPGWELSLVGQNLLHERHRELFSPSTPTEFERSAFLRSIWSF